MDFESQILDLRNRMALTKPLLSGNGGRPFEGWVRNRIAQRFDIISSLTSLPVPDLNSKTVPAMKILGPNYLDNVSHCIDDIRDALSELKSVFEFLPVLDEFIDIAVQRLRTHNMPTVNPAAYSSYQQSRLNWENTVTLLRSTEAAEDSAQQSISSAQLASTSADDAREAAGATAEYSLADIYSKYASDESESANRWRNATLVILTAIAIAAGLYGWIGKTGTHWPDELKRLAILLPLLAISAYTHRVSIDHKRNSLWAQQIAMLLRTIRGYTDPMPLEQREMLRIAFGLRLFYNASITDQRVDSSDSGRVDLATLASQLVATISQTDALRRISGNA